MSILKENVESGDKSILLKNRRFVGVKETVAYVLEDTAQSLNINDFKDRYIYDVVKIDFAYLAIQNTVATVWDTFNDTFIGVIVEKTRTRWGKFRPYLLLGQLPLTILGLWYWLIPFMFPDTPGDYLPKWIFYFAMSIITETAKAAETASKSTAVGTAAIVGIHTGKAELVIAGTLIVIGQHLVGLADFLELFFSGFVTGVAVGVVLHGLLAVGLFYRIGTGILFNAQHLIEITFVFSHIFTS